MRVVNPFRWRRAYLRAAKAGSRAAWRRRRGFASVIVDGEHRWKDPWAGDLVDKYKRDERVRNQENRVHRKVMESNGYGPRARRGREGMGAMTTPRQQLIKAIAKKRCEMSGIRPSGLTGARGRSQVLRRDSSLTLQALSDLGAVVLTPVKAGDVDPSQIVVPIYEVNVAGAFAPDAIVYIDVLEVWETAKSGPALADETSVTGNTESQKGFE